MMKMKARIKDETGKVIRKAKAASIRNLGQAGAYIRGIAKKSIKISPVYAPPGHPPYDHTGARLRTLNRSRKAAGQAPISAGFRGLKHILYAYDPKKRSVVIGPASNRSRPLTIPEILEYGKRGVAGRPFMGPAAAKSRDQFGRIWADSMK
jgi:hypothetical protein